jgi:hypothetical protein
MRKIISIIVWLLIILIGPGNSLADPQAPEVVFSFPPDKSYFPYPVNSLATVGGKASYQQAKETWTWMES